MNKKPTYEKLEKRVKEMEKEIKDFLLFPEVNPNIILKADLTGKITYANPAGHDWLNQNGYSSADGFSKLLPEQFPQLVQMAVSNGKVLNKEIHFNKRYFDFKLRPIPSHKACMVSLTDITVLKKAVIEREIFFQAFQNTDSCICITDLNHNVIKTNKAFENLYGYNEAEIIGKHSNLLNAGRKIYFENGVADSEYFRIFGELKKYLKIREIAFGKEIF